MNLTVRINGQEYKNCVSQGITISEEFNETLDSCVVRITHVPRITDINPYDDVYIYDTDAFEFEHDIQIMRNPNGGTFSNGVVRTADDAGTYSNNPFYRHFLIDQFTENIIRLGEKRADNECEYTFELFSETKRLEKIQLPNLSITQPLNARKRKSVWQYLNIYLELYCPKIKVVDDPVAKTWKYERKYTLAPSLESKFGDLYCPEFTLSNPTFRDILSQLMIVADCIPYVRDDVIYAMDISKRGAEFDIAEEMAKGRINYITSSKSSDDYCDNVRRQYTQALAETGTCEYVENLGFRNKDKALVSLEDLQIETSHDIYKINKIYLSYYINIDVTTEDQENPGQTVTNREHILIRQDITPLVKLRSEWEYLSQDWKSFGSENFTTIYDISKYKLATVYYNQGSNIIGGWGTRYQEIGSSSTWLNTFGITKTHIENILVFLHRYNPFGAYGIQHYRDMFSYSETDTVEISIPTSTGLEFIYNPTVSGLTTGDASITLAKSVFFTIEYTGFYNGALIHSRDKGRDDIVANDNSSSSLALLEKDGINQKEKLNRFANKTYQIQGKIFDLSNLLELSQQTEVGEDSDVIIYKREYALYDNDISVNYLAIKNYVLKDYFVNVYSKYRTYQLMSYGESIRRAESRKEFFLLSTKKKYTDGDRYSTPFLQNISDLFSAFLPSEDKSLKLTSGYYVKSHMLPISVGDYVYSFKFNFSATDNEIKGFFNAITFQSGSSTANLVETSGSIIVNRAYVVKDDISTGSFRLVINNINALIYDPSLPEEEQCYWDITEDAVLATFVNAKISESKIPVSYNGVLFGQSGEGYYMTDCNAFTSGNMLCFNLSMKDNVSGGSYIRRWVSNYGVLLVNPSSDENYTVGEEQGWYDIVDDDETGEIKEMKWTIQKSNVYINVDLPELNPSLNDLLLLERLPRYNELFGASAGGQLPGSDSLYIYEDEDIHKDNKEIIDKTYQLEPYTDDENVVFGSWLTKLSNLLPTYKKYFHGTVAPIARETISFTTTTIETCDYITSMHNYIILLRLSNADIITRIPAEGIDISLIINGNWTTPNPDWKNPQISYNGFRAKMIDGNLVITGSGTYQVTRKHGWNTDTIQGVLGNLVFSYNSSYQRWICPIYHNIADALDPTIQFTSQVFTYIGVDNNYYKNCFIVLDNNMATRDTIYEEPKATELQDSDFENKIQNDMLVSDVFRTEISSEELDGSYEVGSAKIIVDLSKLPTQTTPFSIQYWYLDNKSAYEPNAYQIDDNGKIYAVGTKYEYRPTKCAYHLVFAANITQEDIDAGITEKVIYISMFTNRDTRVFDDSTGSVIGEINNCIIDGEYLPLGYTYTEL